MLRRLSLVASLVCVISSCSASLAPVSSPALRQLAQSKLQPARPVPGRNDALFPVQQGYTWEYAVTVAPVMDPDAEEHGSYTLSIDKAVPTPAGTQLEMRGLSGFNHNLSFPTLVQRPDGIELQNFTFLGIGSDEVQGLHIDFMHTPLQPGMRWEEQNWLGKVKGIEKVTVPAGTFDAWRVEVIGTYDQAYTTVGDYWIVPGAGIVKAVYTVPDFHVEMLLTQASVRPAAPTARPAQPAGHRDLPPVRKPLSR